MRKLFFVGAACIALLIVSIFILHEPFIGGGTAAVFGFTMAKALGQEGNVQAGERSGETRRTLTIILMFLGLIVIAALAHALWQFFT